MSRDKRLGELRKIPPFAAVDHRLFLDKEGQDRRVANLPRKLRRKMEAEGKKIAQKYNQILSVLSSLIGVVGVKLFPLVCLFRAIPVGHSLLFAVGA